MKKWASNILRFLLPLLISAVVLIYTYRDYDFSKVWYDIGRLNLWWILLALIFSWLSPLFRGLRWSQLISSSGYRVSNSVSSLIVFTGYAANIIVPRFGEISRCAILDRYNGVPFSKGLGTLLAERFVDMVLLILISLITIIWQMPMFLRLFTIGANSSVDEAPAGDSMSALWLVIIVVALSLVVWLVRKFRLMDRIRDFLRDLWMGFKAVIAVRQRGRFITYSVAIWICYYLEMYVAFFSLESTSGVGAIAGLVCFVAGSFAVLVPTPNGAGPWHWVVINMLLLYGVPESDAQPLALVLHTAQTFAYLIAGVVAWVMLHFVKNGESCKKVRLTL